MGIEKILQKIEQKEFLIAAGAFVAASVSDYLYTSQGIDSSQARELNPVVQSYMALYGANGLLIGKAIIAGFSLYGFKLLDYCHEHKRTKVKPEPLLFRLAFVTAVAAPNWLHEGIISLYIPISNWVSQAKPVLTQALHSIGM